MKRRSLFAVLFGGAVVAQAKAVPKPPIPHAPTINDRLSLEEREREWIRRVIEQSRRENPFTNFVKSYHSGKPIIEVADLR
jgi:hypothetical protein